jgi:hypothetical protein
MACLWPSLPSSIVPKPAHALITWTKVNLLVLTPHHIWQKCCITFSGCPSFKQFCKLLIPCKKCSTALCLVPLQLSVLPPMAGFIDPQVLPLCSESGYLSFIYNQKSRSSWSAVYFPYPGHKWHHKNRKSCTDLLHQHIAFTYLLQSTILSHQCKGPEENFCQV